MAEKNKGKKKKGIKFGFKMQKQHWIAVSVTAVILLIGVLFLTFNWFGENVRDELIYFVMGIALVMGGIPFIASLMYESQVERNKEQMFLEFSRDLVEGVRSGTPISKSILNVRNKNYGKLSDHIKKLANQISLGIPIKDALDTFSKDVKSKVIARAVTLIREAERAGGEIETILESVVISVSQIEKLRKERKAAIYTIAVQGYIIFIIFIIIMLVMQFAIVPLTTDLQLDAGSEDSGFAGSTGFGGASFSSQKITQEDLASAFLLLLLFQGFFAGLVIGKISEGRVKSGFKHSFILTALALVISTGANFFLGGAG